MDEITESDLTKGLKIFLIERIEDIQRSIRRYHIDGTEGLEKTAKLLTHDLAMVECNLEDKDKNKPIFKRVKAWAITLVIGIVPNLYDIIGAVPDINDFWVPKFEELAEGHKKVEQIIDNTVSLQEALKKASNIFDRQSQKSIAGGKELKALPPSTKDPEADTDDKRDL